MNRYPLWKYLLILTVVVVGFLYSLPNIYLPDPAIQISGQSLSLKIDSAVLNRIETVLDDKGISHFGGDVSDSGVTIRVTSIDDQLKAQGVVQKTLGDDYVVAVNLASTVPDWLTNLGGSPMKLGLDLAGGVHFLLEVDTDKIIRDDVEGSYRQLKSLVRKENIRSITISKTALGLEVQAPTDEARTELTKLLRDEMGDLTYSKSEKDGKFFIDAVYTEAYIREREDYAVGQNLTTLRNRVEELKISEPIVQRQGRNRIVVELPGIQDTARAKTILGKTANLEFRLEALPEARSSQKELFPYKDEKSQARFGGAHLEKRAIVKGDRVTNAQLTYDQDTGLPQVSITLDGQGGATMHKKTWKNVGRRMGILFIEYKTKTTYKKDEDGKEYREFKAIPEKRVISLATIQNGLGKQFRITGLDSPDEAGELALLLRAGALAAPMGFVEERTIGPSLGKENIEVGVKSVQIGLALVLIFMLVYYRAFGFAANIALSFNLVLLVAIMSMTGSTLTLPGIAGIVLTVGMAVDANVLIFSRIKEELKAGVPNQTAIKGGFDRAFITILDANITTLIVALILYAVGTGPIKGFAVTLGIGIITSMFTAIMGTRSIVNLMYGSRNAKKLWI